MTRRSQTLVPSRWLVTLLGLALLALGLSACSGTLPTTSAPPQATPPTAPTAIPTAVPTATATVVPTPTPLPLPTATPQPMVIPAGKESLFVNEKNEKVIVPGIDGLEARIYGIGSEAIVKYFAVEGNQYGIEAGKLAGIFLSNVRLVNRNVTGVEIINDENDPANYDIDKDTTLCGGVSLNPEVVKVLFEKEIAAKNYGSPIPAGIADKNHNTLITVAQTHFTNPAYADNVTVVGVSVPGDSLAMDPFLIRGEHKTFPLLGSIPSGDIVAAQLDNIVSLGLTVWYDKTQVKPQYIPYYLGVFFSQDTGTHIPNGGREYISNEFGQPLKRADGTPVIISQKSSALERELMIVYSGANVYIEYSVTKTGWPMDFDHLVKVSKSDGTFAPIFMRDENQSDTTGQ